MRDLKVHPRFSSRVLWLAACAALAAGAVVAPLCNAAQEPGPGSKPEIASPAATAPADAGHESAKSESAQSEPAQSEEDQQNNAFRLEGPMVKWTAKKLDLSLEMTAGLYEFINFLIIALIIGVPLLRWLPKYLRNRKEKLRSDIESARKVTEDANARLSAVEVKLSKLDEEIQKFRAEVEAESLHDEARIKASLAEESTRIVESAEQEIGVAAAQARRGLRNFAADLAIDQAAKKFVLTAETDRALIAEFVGDVVRNGAGGKD
ncbi:MAG TPA: ATP synthase F0 subunit B [Terracidiphilus sp.]|nr:ATP synthase F0 subunit B [Terracidiphilus sp.]